MINQFKWVFIYLNILALFQFYIDDRRSNTGYAFILAGTAITWEARNQATVAFSGTEAEYIALSEASKETTYARNVLEELKFISAT